jgi:trk system potassium uptake protein
MNILIAGGHQDANFLISSLKSNGHEVLAVNNDQEWCQILTDRYDIETICGNASEPCILKMAHADNMDILIALNEQDAANLIICMIAKNEFNIKHTFAIVNDPKNIEIFQRFGVDKCINTAYGFSRFIDQLNIEDSIKKYLQYDEDRITACEVALTKNSPSINKKLWELGFPPQSLITCIIREDEVIIPQGNTVLMAGDKVIILASSKSKETTVALLSGKTAN